MPVDVTGKVTAACSRPYKNSLGNSLFPRCNSLAARKTRPGIARPRQFVRYFRSRRSALQRHRDEVGRIGRFDLHQDAVTAAAPGVFQRRAAIADIGDALAADVEDDVAGTEAVLGGRTIRIDRGHHDALVAGTLNVRSGSELQPET